MPQGLEVFDEYGRQVMSVTDRLSRFVGVLDTGTNDGATGIWGSGTPWFAVDPQPVTLVGYEPVVYLDGNILRWYFEQSNYRTPVVIVYGLY